MKDVRLSTTGLMAALLTVAFYLGLVGGPLGDSFISQLFSERGWVPYVITYLAVWCGVLLVAKYRRLSQRQRILQLDLLPESIAPRITVEACGPLLAYLQALPGIDPGDLLSRRISMALEYFRARGSVIETIDRLRLQSDRDEGTVDSSYTMLRAFIWAIPILGFIGTVLGIGQSVGGFSESVSAAADLEVMKDSIGVVTSGLGIAFDTTLLALVVSIFIMLPTSSLQKAEEDYLALVDDYCQRHLVVRLEQKSSMQLGPEGEEWLKKLGERLVGELRMSAGPGESGGD
jgi:hypothetical protein